MSSYQNARRKKSAAKHVKRIHGSYLTLILILSPSMMQVDGTNSEFIAPSDLSQLKLAVTLRNRKLPFSSSTIS